MKTRLPIDLVAAILVVSALALCALVAPLAPRSQDLSGWLESGDPCYPTKQLKKHIRETSRVDPFWLECVPLDITVTWDIEESFHRSTGVGDDRARFTLEDTFRGYLELHFNRMKKSEVESFSIQAPSPCCPGGVDAALLRVDAVFVVCDSWGRNCRPFATADALLFQVTPPEDTFFGFEWENRNGFEQGKGGFGSSRVRLPMEVLPREFNIRSGSRGVLYEDRFRVAAYGKDALTWKDIRPALERGALTKVFSFEKSGRTPDGSQKIQRGKATVLIEFGEAETEHWQVRVEGWEMDAFRPPVKYTDAKGVENAAPVAVEFSWALEGRFSTRARKGMRKYAEGEVVKGSVAPSLAAAPPELFRCTMDLCPGETEPTQYLGGAYLQGRVQGQNVTLTWPTYHPAQCVLCSPRVSFIKAPPYRERFGTREFLSRISREALPLRDGAVVTGGVGDWMKYKITLKKLK